MGFIQTPGLSLQRLAELYIPSMNSMTLIFSSLHCTANYSLSLLSRRYMKVMGNGFSHYHFYFFQIFTSVYFAAYVCFVDLQEWQTISFPFMEIGCSSQHKTVDDECREQRNFRRRLRYRETREKEKRAKQPKFNTPSVPPEDPPSVYAYCDLPFSLRRVPDCTFCGAKRMVYEPLGFCCCQGEVVLASNEMSSLLKDLFIGNDLKAKHFQSAVRTYNNTFAFTSIGIYNYDKDLCKRNKGIYTFKVQGQIYHFLNDLLPDGSPPRNLQLYFFDNAQ